MPTVLGDRYRLCDRVTRRSFLRIGGLAMGGLSLSRLRRADSQSLVGRSEKAVIIIYLPGGPSHLDLWDIKTEAPREIRGEFRPIATRVPGIQIGECFPKIAAVMDKLVLIRTVVGSTGSHDAHQCLSGWSRRDDASIGGHPSIGSVLAKLKGPTGLPPHVGLAAKTRYPPWSEAGSPGFLGADYGPFRPDAQSITELPLGRLAEALDVTREDPKTRARYGDGKPYRHQGDGAPTGNEQLLQARRLVEAGVRCVSLSYGCWDSHVDNFVLVRDHGPKFDQAVSALVEDLDARGLLDDVTVLVWGEFGRTPRINRSGGRDHWPRVACALLAGGGMPTGQVIGETNRRGESPKDRPAPMQEIVATVYRNLGIDPTTTTLEDPTGRQQPLLTIPEPMAEFA